MNDLQRGGHENDDARALMRDRGCGSGDDYRDDVCALESLSVIYSTHIDASDSFLLYDDVERSLQSRRHVQEDLLLLWGARFLMTYID